MEQLPTAFAALAQYRQWLVWKAVPGKRAGKIDKIPISPTTGRATDPTDPAGHVSAEQALAVVQQWGASTPGQPGGYGLAFVLRGDDPFWLLDIDDALDAGQWSETAQYLCAQFPGAMIEVSHSGGGLHIIGSGVVPDHSCRNSESNLDFFTADRFIALTGLHATGDAATDHTPAAARLVADYFPPGPTAGASASTDAPEWTDEPVPGWSGPTSDDELITRALQSTSAAGALAGRASFRALWEADEDTLARNYPGDRRPYDESAVDAALAQHLAFWTGKDCERMRRLMRLSDLYREKWEREDYLPRTILKAVSQQTDVYRENHGAAKPEAPIDTPEGTIPVTTGELREGFQFLPPSAQLEYFAGCVYVQDIHRIFTPDGALLTPQQFKSTYGGFVFALDAIGDKTTKNAWEAFTESQAIRFPKVSGMTFRPLEQPNAILREEGRTLVNTYVPVDVPMRPGDPSPILDHLARILPDETDREILIAYMAACVQYKGVKFRWAPLLQGLEGNGKTLYSKIVAYAVGRRYSHSPPASDIDNKFNAWLYGKLFIWVEDVYIPEHRREVIEALKPMITGEESQIQYKGADQIMADVCANFMLNSNHKDAIRKTATDRRFAVFYTAQQFEGDLRRAGLDGEYFPRLYNWLREGGYEIMADYLATYDIPHELNPAGAQHRAPNTSSTAEARRLTAGSIEQQIMEAVEEARPGFAGDWISSMALDGLLRAARVERQIPPNKRRDLLRHLGYDYHPALHDGRTSNVVQPDGGKPRLFVRLGSGLETIKTAAEACRAYEQAQSGTAGAPGSTSWARG